MATDDKESVRDQNSDIIEQLAKEMRSGDFTQEDLDLVSKKITGQDGSTNARIKHLQNEVNDLSAYTEALEEFLDDNGTAQQLIEDIHDDLASLESDLDVIDDQVDTNTDDVDRLKNRLSDFKKNLADIQESIDQFDTLDEQLASVEDDISEIQNELDEVARLRDRLSAVFNPD